MIRFDTLSVKPSRFRVEFTNPRTCPQSVAVRHAVRKLCGNRTQGGETSVRGFSKTSDEQLRVVRTGFLRELRGIIKTLIGAPPARRANCHIGHCVNGRVYADTAERKRSADRHGVVHFSLVRVVILIGRPERDGITPVCRTADWVQTLGDSSRAATRRRLLELD